jgi:tripartite-type tricarboxylate transporter receptor subunit TctC
MRFAWRRLLQLAASAAAAPTLRPGAWALAYPTRPLRFIVGLSAGGGSDTVARIMALAASSLSISPLRRCRT